MEDTYAQYSVMNVFESLDNMIRDSDVFMERFNFRLKHHHRGIKKRKSTMVYPMSKTKILIHELRHRPHYSFELIIEGFGKVYSARKNVSMGEHLVRMRFRKKKGAFAGWDVERERFVVRKRKRPAGFYRENPEFRYFGF